MTLWSALLEVELEAATLLEVVKGVVMLMVMQLFCRCRTCVMCNQV